MMVIESDNTATNLVIDNLGLETMDAEMGALGLKNTWLYKKIFQPAKGPMPPIRRNSAWARLRPRDGRVDGALRDLSPWR